MKNPFRARALSFNVKAVNDTIQRALTAAGLDTSSGLLHKVSETIQRALASGGVAGVAAPPLAPPVVSPGITRIGESADAGQWPAQQRPLPRPVLAPGSFDRHEFSNSTGTRAYKLYAPALVPAGPMPVLVMLHGCTQSADDFAAGTQMNRLADEHGLLVVYPEQAAQANPAGCWNWFKPQDQRRDAGEPSLIAGIVREVAARHGADPRRIFIAGLSAGAAMAVVMGQTYPELFAGVGAHSGLPYASAHDMVSALAAMKGRRGGLPGLQRGPEPVAGAARPGGLALPSIVFHGDRDHTVQQSNGAAIIDQALGAHQAQAGATRLTMITQRGQASGGRSWSRTIHADGAGQAQIESWTVHGAGHAWAGGDPCGSYTDAAGPDASAEMVRFFLALPRAGSA